MDTKLWTQESDNYTNRAIGDLSGDIYNKKRLELIKREFEILKKFSSSPTRVLDLGCSYGASIYGLKTLYKDAHFYGLDPGVDSIKIAKENNPEENMNFQTGHSHELPYEDQRFQIIILSMVLQWVPRKLLLKTITEIDRVLDENGIIYIREFLPNRPVTSVSKHDSEILIFKDDYSKHFTNFPWYREVHREVDQVEEGEDQQRVSSVLRKYPLNDVYLFKKGPGEK